MFEAIVLLDAKILHEDHHPSVTDGWRCSVVLTNNLSRVRADEELDRREPKSPI
jgi:hypothetical protein